MSDEREFKGRPTKIGKHSIKKLIMKDINNSDEIYRAALSVIRVLIPALEGTMSEELEGRCKACESAIPTGMVLCVGCALQLGKEILEDFIAIRGVG